MVLMKTPSQLTYWLISVQQSPGGMRAESNYYFRLNNIELTVQKMYTICDFIRFRIAISGRTAFKNIAYKNILSLETHRVNDLFEQLARPADKRSALFVLVCAGSFTNKNNPCSGITFAWYRTISCFAELTAAAFSDFLLYFFEFLTGLWNL